MIRKRFSGDGDMDNSDRATYYRNLATQLRAIAMRVLDPEIRNELLDTATQFDQLGCHLEQRRGTE
jgi:hypothetical protein